MYLFIYLFVKQKCTQNKSRTTEFVSLHNVCRFSLIKMKKKKKTMPSVVN